MKKFWNSLSKITFHPVTTIAIFLALISGRYKPLFLHLVIALIHELGHITAALFYKVKIDHILVLPFGVFAQMDDLQSKKIHQEIIILLAGPLMFFINIILLETFYKNGIISAVSLSQALVANKLILWFNLLPIYPLDGGRILGALLSIFFSIKKVFKILFICSFLTTLFLIVYTINNPQYLLWSFLLFSQIEFFIKKDILWIRFLISRLSLKKPKRDKIHTEMDIYRPYNNYIFYNNILYMEDQVIPLLLNYQKRLYKK